jgi:tetratricopeptide (TPR) repeat protein
MSCPTGGLIVIAMRVGDRVGAWTLLRPVGEGAHGATWYGKDGLGREVAIKLLHNAPGPELQAMRRIVHPGVPELFGAGLHPTPYLAMGWSSGQPFPAAADPLIAAAWLFDALACVHRAGLVHADLKPENLLVESDGRVALIDFGFAVNGDGGNIKYAAPERLSGEIASSAADVYSAALMLWEALGPWPLPKDHLDRARATLPEPPGPPWLATVLKAALSTDPGSRPSASAFSDTFAAHGYTIPGPTAGFAARRAPSIDYDPRGIGAAAEASTGDIALYGGRRSGKSHHLHQLAMRSVEAGRTTIVFSGHDPIPEQLERLLHEHDAMPAVVDDADLHLERVIEAAGHALGAGGLLLIDDADQCSARDLHLIDDLARALRLSRVVTRVAAPGLALRPYTPEETAALITEVLGVDVGADFAEAVHDRTDGRPGLTIAAIDSAFLHGILRWHAGRFVVEVSRLIDVEDLALGDSIMLPEHWRDVVCALAAVPSETLTALAEVIERPEAETLEILEEAAVGLVVRRAHDRWSVSRALAPSLAMSPAAAPWHRRWLGRYGTGDLLNIARHLPYEPGLAAEFGAAAVRQLLARDVVAARRLADHLWTATQSPTLAILVVRARRADGDMDAARSFGAVALGRYPQDRTLRVEVAALDLATAPSTTIEALDATGLGLADLDDAAVLRLEALFLSGDHAAVVELGERVTPAAPANDSPESVDRWLHARRHHGQALAQLRRPTEAMVLLRLPADLGRGRAARALVDAALGRLLAHAGRPTEAAEAFSAASRAGSGLGALQRARLENNVGILLHGTGKRNDAVTAWERARLLFDRLGDGNERMRVRANLTVGYTDLGRFDRARRCGEEALELADALGAPDFVALVAGNIGESWLAEGSAQSAEPFLARAEKVAVEHGLTAEAAETARRRALQAVIAGRPDAMTRCDRAIREARTEDLPDELAFARALRAVCLARGANRELAEAEVEKLLSEFHGDRPIELIVRRWLADACLAMGNPERARDLVEPVRVTATNLGLAGLAAQASAVAAAAADALTQSSDDVETMLRWMVLVNRSQTMEELLQRIADGALSLIGGERAFCILRTPIEATVCSREGSNRPGAPSQSTILRALSSAAPVIATRLEDEDFDSARSVALLSLTSVVCCAIQVRGSPGGVLYLDSTLAQTRNIRDVARRVFAMAECASAVIDRQLQLAQVQAPSPV